jgi:hypothetical protein
MILELVFGRPFHADELRREDCEASVAEANSGALAGNRIVGWLHWCHGRLRCCGL